MRSPFARGPATRPLHLTVDTAALPKSDVVDLLLDLGNHDQIDLTTTAEAGFSTLSVDDTAEPSRNEIIDVRTYRADGSRWCSGIWNAGNWLSTADEDAARRGLDPRVTRSRYLLAGAVAGQTDGLVIDDTHFVHNMDRTSNALDPRQATALAGLFLRSHGLLETSTMEWAGRTTLHTQYFVAARMILPAAWRWWSACVHTDKTPAGEITRGAGEAILARFPRCIRARDEVLYQCLVPVGQSDQEEILYHLDMLLLMLSGMFDATAVVANHAYGLGVARPSWRHSGLRTKLAKAAPDVHALTDSASPARTVMDLISKARNTIHGQPLGGVHYSSGSKSMHQVRLPAHVSHEMQQATAELGGPAFWGLQASRDGTALLDPLPFVQVVLPFAAAFLNAVMAATDVERLPGVDPAKLTAEPPSSDIFEPEHVRRVCLLVGLAS